MKFLINRKKVKFPAKLKTVPHGPVHGRSQTLEDEIGWHLSNRPDIRYKKIDGVKFVFVEKYEADGCASDVYWGWGLPLYNLWKLLHVLGYKDMINNATTHGHIYRYQDINMSVLNLCHAILKDFKVPHLPDSIDDDSDDDSPSLPALPIIQQYLDSIGSLPPVTNPSSSFINPNFSEITPPFNPNSSGAP